MEEVNLVELKQDGGSVSVERAQSSKSNRTRQRRISSLRKGVQDVKRKAEHLVDRLKSTNYWSYDKIFWYISLVLAIIGIIVYPVNEDLDTLIWAIFYLVVALFGMWHVWNYAYLVALGQSAEELRSTVKELEEQNKIYKQNVEKATKERDRLDASNEKIKASAEKFSKAVDFLGGAVEEGGGLSLVTNKYKELLETSRRQIRERAKLAKQEAKLDFEQRLAREKRQAELIKNYARDLFNEADTDRSRSISKKEVPRLQKRLFSTLHISVNFDNELKNKGELMRFDMIEKLRDLADAQLLKKKARLEKKYSKTLKEISSTYDTESENPLSDEVFKAMGIDSEKLPDLPVEKNTEEKKIIRKRSNGEVDL